MPLYSKNGQYPKPLPHRIFLSNGMSRTDASSFTEAEIADAGYVLAPEQPLIQGWQSLSWTGTEWTVQDISIEVLKQQKVEQINTLRNAKIYSQKTVVLASGQTVPVDVRINKPDLQNISALVQKATLSVMRGDTTPIDFRGADDNLYTLTPQETLELGETVLGSIELEYKKSWALKDTLKTFISAQQVYEFSVEQNE